MKRNLPETDRLLDLIRDGRPMTLRQQLRLTVELSVPAIIAQLSSIIMQYIDAAMVGRVGAEASASIGLVSTTTWLFWGLCTAAATGFSVQVAHRIGAGDLKGARMILQQSLAGTLIFSLLLAILGAGISSSLPAWLGGDVSIRRDSSVYFFIFSIFLPVLQMIFSGWRHAALQWEYAYSQSAGCHHVRAGCGIQFLSDFSDTRMQRCRHTVHPSGRRTGCERCRPGYGCRRDRRCRCAALVSADALGETELPQP